MERELGRLRDTLRALRGESGCPWDREQSMDDIMSYLIDESYELLQAGRSGNLEEVEEELGDVLFLVIFVHELLLERRKSSLAQIVSRAHKKIVERHPHVFGSRTAKNSRESLAEWDRIKRNEGKRDDKSPTLGSIPPELPPLRKAAAIQKKAAEVGFDWPDHRGILDKFREEIGELEKALATGERKIIKEEIGDLLFTVVNLARQLQVSPENALEATSGKFIERFSEMERKVRGEGRTLDSLTLDEMEGLWQDSKDKT